MFLRERLQNRWRSIPKRQNNRTENEWEPKQTYMPLEHPGVRLGLLRGRATKMDGSGRVTGSIAVLSSRVTANGGKVSLVDSTRKEDERT
jgi:hypothetical protein